jgi:hypothetical protein
MAHNYEADNVPPPVIALQGVVDPTLRLELEDTINAFGCEWREPDLLAADSADILADDVTHLYEGPFIAANGRTPKEAACFLDAKGQGCVLLATDVSLVAVLQVHPTLEHHHRRPTYFNCPDMVPSNELRC